MASHRRAQEGARAHKRSGVKVIVTKDKEYSRLRAGTGEDAGDGAVMIDGPK